MFIDFFYTDWYNIRETKEKYTKYIAESSYRFLLSVRNKYGQKGNRKDDRNDKYGTVAGRETQDG